MARGIPAEVLEHFRGVPLFAGLSKAGLRAVVQAATEVDVAAGTTIVREGQTDRFLYVIVSGSAAVTQKGIAASARLAGVDRRPSRAVRPAAAPAMIGTHTPGRILSDLIDMRWRGTEELTRR